MIPQEKMTIIPYTMIPCLLYDIFEVIVSLPQEIRAQTPEHLLEARETAKFLGPRHDKAEQLSSKVDDLILSYICVCTIIYRFTVDHIFSLSLYIYI